MVFDTDSISRTLSRKIVYVLRQILMVELKSFCSCFTIIPMASDDITTCYFASHQLLQSELQYILKYSETPSPERPSHHLH